MTKPLLIEIGLEELPADPLLKELPNIEKKWKKILDEYSFSSEFNFFYTPRRFVLWHREFSEKQPDRKVEQFGAPVAIAFKDGQPTKACEGFARKCGVSVDELGRSEKGGKEVLYYSFTEEGKELKTLLGEMVEKWLKSLHFGKSMKWGTGEFEFIRPIHSIVTMFGTENLPINIYGVKSEPKTFGHRNSENPEIWLTHTGDYFCNLPKQGVMVKQSERELTIRHQFQKLEAKHGIKVEIDEGLLSEVMAITEEPTSLLGNFGSEFLELPDDVIVTSMREHQRYFPVYRDGELTNSFIVVSNSLTDDFSLVVAGNEKVLRARLSDALFFYRNDLKNGLRPDGLEKLLFVDGLGFYSDKVSREEKIATELAKLYNISEKEDLKRAVNLSKNDLMSEMVFEFTELQGLMGSYYAEKLGEKQNIADAIREQYSPNGESDNPPSTPFSAVVAMSYKIDLLFGLFSIGHIPTGSRDPFGLRRAVVGLLRTALQHNLKFDLIEIYNLVKDNYKEFDLEKLKVFYFERVSHFYKVNPSIVKSVLSVETEILEIDQKIKTVDEVTSQPDFEEKLSTFKRVANILKDGMVEAEIDSSLLIEEAEKELFKALTSAKEESYQNHSEKLNSLFGLKPALDSFFDGVMVNAEDEKVKTNRKALLSAIYREFLSIADIKEISVR